MREVWQEQNGSDHGLLVFASGRLTEKGGGHPKPEAVGELFEKMEVLNDVLNETLVLVLPKPYCGLAPV